MHPSFFNVFACLLIALLGSACSNFKPVTTFAVQTRTLANAFDPMLEQAMHSCTNNVRRTGIITDRPFQPQAAMQDATRRCQPYAGALASMAQLNHVVRRYADVLATLSNDKLARSKDEFGALGDALGALPSGDASLLDADKVKRVMQLSELLSRIATERRQQDGIAQLLAREDDIVMISDTLRTYAQQHYRDNLRDESQTMALLERALDNSGAHEPLAANTLRAKMALDRQQLVERGKQVAAYAEAVSELQRSLAALRSKAMNDAQLAQQLDNYASRVDALQRAAAQQASPTW